jgi:hypothetical protein
VTINKHIRRDHPYVGSTFHDQAELLTGRSNCIISGGEITEADPSSTPREIEIADFVANLGGIIVSVSDGDPDQTVQFSPQTGTMGGDQYLLLSTPDDRLSSGVVWKVVDHDSDISAADLVFAIRRQGVSTDVGATAAWISPNRVSISAASDGLWEPRAGVYEKNSQIEGLSLTVEHDPTASVASGGPTDATVVVAVSPGRSLAGAGYIDSEGADKHTRIPLHEPSQIGGRIDTVVLKGRAPFPPDSWFRSADEDPGLDRTPALAVITGTPGDEKVFAATSVVHKELVAAGLPTGEPKGGQGALAIAAGNWSDSTDGSYKRNPSYNRFMVAWLADAAGAELLNIGVVDPHPVTGLDYVMEGVVAIATRKDFSMVTLTTGSAALVHTATDGGREKLYFSRSTAPTAPTPSPTTLDLEDVLLIDNTNATLAAVYATSDIRRPKILSNERDEVVVIFEATSSGAGNLEEVLWAIKIDPVTGAVISGPSRVSSTAAGQAFRFADAVWLKNGTITCTAIRDVQDPPNLEHGEAVVIDFDSIAFERVAPAIDPDKVLSNEATLGSWWSDGGGPGGRFRGHNGVYSSDRATNSSIVLIDDNFPAIVFGVVPDLAGLITSGVAQGTQLFMYAGTAESSHFGRSYSMVSGSGPTPVESISIYSLSADSRLAKNSVVISDGLGFQVIGPGQVGWPAISYARFNLEALAERSFPPPLDQGVSFIAGTAGSPEMLSVARGASGTVAAVSIAVDAGGDYRINISTITGSIGEPRPLLPWWTLLGKVNVPSAPGILASDSVYVGSTGRLDELPSEIVVSARGGSGDLVGPEGVSEALRALRGVGGTIRVKAGRYVFRSPIQLTSGIKLRLDSGASFINWGYGELFSVTGSHCQLTNIDQRTFTIDLIGATFQETLLGDIGFCEGDILGASNGATEIEPPDQYPEHIANILQQVDTSSAPMNSIELSVGGAGPATYLTMLHMTNIEISGGSFETNKFLKARFAAKIKVSGARVRHQGNSFNVPFSIRDCRDVTIENCSFEVPAPVQHNTVFELFEKTRDTTLEGNRFSGFGHDFATASPESTNMLRTGIDNWGMRLVDNTFHNPRGAVVIHAQTSGIVEGNRVTDQDPSSTSYHIGLLYPGTGSKLKLGRNEFLGTRDDTIVAPNYQSTHGASFHQVDISENLNVAGFINGGYYDAAIQTLQFVVADMIGFDYFTMIDGIIEDYSDFEDLSHPTNPLLGGLILSPGIENPFPGFGTGPLEPIHLNYAYGLSDCIAAQLSRNTVRFISPLFNFLNANIPANHHGMGGSLGTIRGVSSHHDITAGTIPIAGYLDRDKVAVTADPMNEGGATSSPFNSPALQGWPGDTWQAFNEYAWTRMGAGGEAPYLEGGQWPSPHQCSTFTSCVHHDHIIGAWEIGQDPIPQANWRYGVYGGLFSSAERPRWIKQKILAAWTDPHTRRIVLVRELFRIGHQVEGPGSTWKKFLNAQVIDSLTGHIMGDADFPIACGGAETGLQNIGESPIAMGVQMKNWPMTPEWDQDSWTCGWVGDVVIKKDLEAPTGGFARIFVAAGMVPTFEYTAAAPFDDGYFHPASSPEHMVPAGAITRIFTLKLNTDVSTWGGDTHVSAADAFVELRTGLPGHQQIRELNRVQILWEIEPSHNGAPSMFGGALIPRTDDAPIIPGLSVQEAPYAFNGQAVFPNPGGSISNTNNYIVAWVHSHRPDFTVANAISNDGTTEWRVRARIYSCELDGILNDNTDPLTGGVIISHSGVMGGTIINRFIGGRHINSSDVGGPPGYAGVPWGAPSAPIAASGWPAGWSRLGFNHTSSGAMSEHYKLAGQPTQFSAAGPIDPWGTINQMGVAGSARWPWRPLNVFMTDASATNLAPGSGWKHLFVEVVNCVDNADPAAAMTTFAVDWNAADNAAGGEFTAADGVVRALWGAGHSLGMCWHGPSWHGFTSVHDDAPRLLMAFSERKPPTSSFGVSSALIQLHTYDMDPTHTPRSLDTALSLFGVGAGDFRPLRNFLAAPHKQLGVKDEIRVCWQGRGGATTPQTWENQMSWNYARAYESAAGSLSWSVNPSSGAVEPAELEELDAGGTAWLGVYPGGSLGNMPLANWDDAQNQGESWVVGDELHEALFWVDELCMVPSAKMAGATPGGVYAEASSHSANPIERMIYFQTSPQATLVDRSSCYATLRSVAHKTYVKVNLETRLENYGGASNEFTLEVVGGSQSNRIDGGAGTAKGIRIFPQTALAQPAAPPASQAISTIPVHTGDLYDTVSGVGHPFAADVGNTETFEADWSSVAPIVAAHTNTSSLAGAGYRAIPFPTNGRAALSHLDQLWTVGTSALMLMNGSANEIIPNEFVHCIRAGDLLYLHNNAVLAVHIITFVGRGTDALGTNNAFVVLWPKIAIAPDPVPANNWIQILKPMQGYLIAGPANGGGNIVYPERIYLNKVNFEVTTDGYAESVSFDTSPAAPTNSLVATIKITDPTGTIYNAYTSGSTNLSTYLRVSVSRDGGATFDELVVPPLDGATNPIYASPSPEGGWSIIIRGVYNWMVPPLQPTGNLFRYKVEWRPAGTAADIRLDDISVSWN